LFWSCSTCAASWRARASLAADFSRSCAESLRATAKAPTMAITAKHT
jgi:hypothetical protein